MDQVGLASQDAIDAVGQVASDLLIQAAGGAGSSLMAARICVCHDRISGFGVPWTHSDTYSRSVSGPLACLFQPMALCT